jgi:hypothetical protein
MRYTLYITAIVTKYLAELPRTAIDTRRKRIVSAATPDIKALPGEQACFEKK